MSTPEPLMNRGEVARAAGVAAQAVSNWMRRHPDFPQLVRRGSREGYPASEVAAWLDSRHIPRPSLRKREHQGVTYGDRFRSAVGIPAPPAVSDTTGMQVEDPLDERLWAPLERLLRKSEVPAVFEAVVLSLLCLRETSPVGWSATSRASVETIHEIVMQAWHRQPERMMAATRVVRDVPATVYARHQLVEIVRILSTDRAPAAQVFEYLLDRFAKYRHSSPDEYLIPTELAGLMVRMLDPAPGSRIHDPCCGPGNLLVAAGKYMSRVTRSGSPVTLTGRAATVRTWSLAMMNAAIHRMQVDLGDGPPSYPAEIDADPGLFDVVLLNPPFGMRNWSRPASRSLRPWPYGEPSAHNVTWAWLQTAVEALVPDGRAAVVMPYSATSARTAREREIRKAMVERGAVRCIVALPSHLFRETTVPVTVWILAHPSNNASSEILFIDARAAARRISPTHRVLTERGCHLVLDAFHGWVNGTVAFPSSTDEFAATTATVAEIQEHVYDLQPVTYLNQRGRVGPAPQTPPQLRALRADLARLDDAARIADLTLDRCLAKLVT
ncbi:N-6 DNA methylase [Solwaraspora sp. WMMD937]|uniref:HsdM family class I SAM-dependent methyltransferase n=1 Tax=Solwaraspora sp. WMMD937 TaxID=3016090 RepID=UPI00249A629C|nr:N-6 DNA methylase [Solwaraspora sp. WMMD937]WFE22801.1 N-6 DNA methylase [Solwaraspora sp. WMMD937]